MLRTLKAYGRTYFFIADLNIEACAPTIKA